MIKANPAVAMLADVDRRFKSYLVEFGLTPAARSKVQIKDDEPKEDQFAEFFG
ncbi:Phage terminase, small subunit [compost metagenome]